MMDSWRISEWLYVFTDSLQWKVGRVSSETAEAPCFQMRGLDRASTPRRNGRGLDSSLIRQDIRGLEHLNSPRKSLGLLEEAFGGCGSPILRHRRYLAFQRDIVIIEALPKILLPVAAGRCICISMTAGR
jgi:hypothetical protein